MFITASNLVHYLVSRGTISADSVVDGDFIVAEAGRRNRNFKVIRRKSPGLFVKQIKTFDQQAIFTLQREAACYRIAQSDARYSTLAGLMPRFVDYDPSRYALILELVNGGENLTEHHQKLRSFPVEVGRMLGEGLGAYQSEVGRLFGAGADFSLFPRQVPWILSLHNSGDAMFSELSTGNTQLVALLRRYPDYQALLDQVRNDWQYDSLIHGDMKWDNCLVFRNEAGGFDFRIVDWELADVGDACWDVGAILQAYLTFWILSMPITPGVPPEQFIDKAAYRLEDMQPAIREFWASYIRVRGIDPASAGPILERCVRYGAARMVQTAFEYLYYASQLTGYAIILLQVSLNILKNPKEAAGDLLGL